MDVVLLSLGGSAALDQAAVDYAAAVLARSATVQRRHVEDAWDARALAGELEDLTASARAAVVEPSAPQIVRPPVHPQRLVVAGTVAGLARVLRRLRRPRVAATVVTGWLGGLLPSDAVPPYLARLGYPGDLDGQLAAVVGPSVRQVGLVADDSGGVLISDAVLRRWPDGGAPLWVRAYADDERLCDGPIRSLTVRRSGPDEVTAIVTAASRWRRGHRARGRAVQLACDDALIVSDGIARDQPRSKRTWWCEPEGWLLPLP